jgi:hypothetical protein
MRKLLLGVALMAVNRILARRVPSGWRGLLSPRGMMGTIIAAAAGELLARRAPRRSHPA